MIRCIVCLSVFILRQPLPQFGSSCCPPPPPPAFLERQWNKKQTFAAVPDQLPLGERNESTPSQLASLLACHCYPDHPAQADSFAYGARSMSARFTSLCILKTLSENRGAKLCVSRIFTELKNINLLMWSTKVMKAEHLTYNININFNMLLR